MPVQKTQARFDINKSLAKHAADETDYGQDFTRLPAGISGIARLVSAKIGTYKTGDNTGQQYVRLAATVLEPVEAPDVIRAWENDGTKEGKVIIVSSAMVRTKGLQTSLMLPLCDTKKQDADTNTKEMLNHLRRLTDPNFTADVATFKDLEEKLALLEQLKPIFRFSTSAQLPNRQYPEHRAWENWNGNEGLADYQDSAAADAANAVNDGTGGTPSKNGEPAKEPPFNEFAGGNSTDEAPDIEALVEAANKTDGEEAQAKLKELAMAAGKTEEEVDDATSWQQVAAMISEGGEGGDAAAGESAQNPSKGDLYGYKPIDPKTKKPGKKKVQIELLSSDEKAETCTAKFSSDDKTIMAANKKPLVIKWSDLEEAD
jgi:hypothetical protein